MIFYDRSASDDVKRSFWTGVASVWDISGLLLPLSSDKSSEYRKYMDWRSDPTQLPGHGKIDEYLRRAQRRLDEQLGRDHTTGTNSPAGI